MKIKVADGGRDFNTRNYFYFGILLVIQIEFGQFGFPSMPKREIVENRLKKPIKEGDCKGILLRTYKYASIIFLSLMSNLLFADKTTAYMI